MIKKLIEFGADVKVETVNGDTPLHFITSADHRNLAAMLLEKGADVYKKNSSGESPLDLADKTVNRKLFVIDAIPSSWGGIFGGKTI